MCSLYFSAAFSLKTEFELTFASISPAYIAKELLRQTPGVTWSTIDPPASGITISLTEIVPSAYGSWVLQEKGEVYVSA